LCGGSAKNANRVFYRAFAIAESPTIVRIVTENVRLSAKQISPLFTLNCLSSGITGETRFLQLRILAEATNLLGGIVRRDIRGRPQSSTDTMGSKCRICETLKDKHIITIGINDLASQYPAIAAQWDVSKNEELTAEQVMPGSNAKIWWLCKRGHSWQATVLSRTFGANCPRCNGKTPMPTHFIT
jgi:hypothetical protein